MEKWTEANTSNFDKLQVFKNDFPEGLKNIIYKFAFALRKASNFQTEITFNISKIKDVQDALFEYSKTNKKIELQTLSNGHFGFSYPENHRGSEWIRFRSTGLKSLTDNTAGIAQQLGLNIDDARELGAAVCIVLIQNKISKRYFLNDIYDLKIFKQIKTSALGDVNLKNILNVITFLKKCPDKFNIAWTCALTANKVFKKIPNFNFKDFCIHHKSKWFNAIKNHGAALSKLNPDKWNPSDLFLIKKGSLISDKLKMKNIVNFNKYVSSNTDIIGISLKESESGALHGSVSGRKVLEYLRIPDVSTSSENEINTFFGNLKYFSKMGTQCFVKTSLDGPNYFENAKTELTNLLKEVEHEGQTISPISPNFFKSMREGITVFNKLFEYVKKNGHSLNEVFKTIYQYTSSQLSTSCGYEKIMGSYYHHIKNKTIKHFGISGIYIPCNGETQIISTIKIDKSQNYTLQFRSKGGAPQFILIKRVSTKNGYLPV